MILPLSGLNKRQNQLLLRVLGASERLWANRQQPTCSTVSPGAPMRTNSASPTRRSTTTWRVKRLTPFVAEKLESIYLRSRHKRTVPVGIADTWWHVN